MAKNITNTTPASPLPMLFTVAVLDVSRGSRQSLYWRYRCIGDWGGAKHAKRRCPPCLGFWRWSQFLHHWDDGEPVGQGHLWQSHGKTRGRNGRGSWKREQSKLHKSANFASIDCHNSGHSGISVVGRISPPHNTKHWWKQSPIIPWARGNPADHSKWPIHRSFWFRTQKCYFHQLWHRHRMRVMRDRIDLGRDGPLDIAIDVACSRLNNDAAIITT